MNLQLIKPMLASASPRPHSQLGRRYQRKLNGIRCTGYKQRDEQTLRGRRDDGLPPDITHRFPEIKIETATDDAIVDGELVVMVDGKPDFNAIQQRNTDNRLSIRVLSKTLKAQYHVFDIMYCGDHLTTAKRLGAREEVLKRVLRENENVVIEPSYAEGEWLFEEAIENGMEGIMAKRIDSPYSPGVRSYDWLKIKPLKTELFWACGLTKGTGSRNGSFGAIILGEFTDAHGAPRFVGCVGSGLTDRDLAEWSQKESAPCPFDSEPKLPKPLLRWIRMEAIAVSYFEKTPQGLGWPRLAS